jgi:hypothetical protein
MPYCLRIAATSSVRMISSSGETPDGRLPELEVVLHDLRAFETAR